MSQFFNSYTDVPISSYIDIDYVCICIQTLRIRYICTLYTHTIYTTLYLHRQVLYTCYLVQTIHAISTRSDHGARCRLLESPTHQEILQLTRMKMRSQRWNMLEHVVLQCFWFCCWVTFLQLKALGTCSTSFFCWTFSSCCEKNWHFDTLF